MVFAGVTTAFDVGVLGASVLTADAVRDADATAVSPILAVWLRVCIDVRILYTMHEL